MFYFNPCFMCAFQYFLNFQQRAIGFSGSLVKRRLLCRKFDKGSSTLVHLPVEVSGIPRSPVCPTKSRGGGKTMAVMRKETLHAPPSCGEYYIISLGTSFYHQACEHRLLCVGLVHKGDWKNPDWKHAVRLLFGLTFIAGDHRLQRLHPTSRYFMCK